MYVYPPTPPAGVIEPLNTSLVAEGLLPTGRPASLTSASVSLAVTVTLATLSVNVVVDKSPSASRTVYTNTSGWFEVTALAVDT